MQIGYCTNVHAGADLAATRHNLETHAIEVRQRFRPEGEMGIGLWLSAATASHLLEGKELADFAAWLNSTGLVPFTLNGFPFGDFHQDRVKHDVYQPTWQDPARLAYTQNLATILDQILPTGRVGSISTLPIMWGHPKPDETAMQSASEQLLAIAGFLERLESERGRLIHLCLEPEPGCVLETGDQIISFFERYLLEQAPGGLDVCRYLRVCHDICHAAVMYENQSEMFRRYYKAGILIGKVQVSSAIRVRWDQLADETTREQAAAQLAQFAEDRYLHQTTVDPGPRGQRQFYEDLPLAFREAERAGEWRVHYHVPIYLEQFGHLRTTRDEIDYCLQAIGNFSDVDHFEVETYAWNVLPQELQHQSLAEGIAAELDWFTTRAQQSGED